MEDIRPRDRARKFHASYHGSPKQRSVETHGHTLQHFRPPQSVSDDEEQSSTNTAAPLILNTPQSRPKKSFKQRLKDLTAKQWILIGSVAAILLLGGGALAAWALWPAPEEPAAPVVREPEPEPEPIVSNLTGLEVDASVNERPVFGIMIENSMRARPQSGLHQAGVVYEAIAEGGITRFLALYQDSVPDHIGPVRSARTPWVEWMLGYDAVYAHAGGSPEALQFIRDWNVKDLDSSRGGGAFWRIPERSSPHNLYTSIERLRAAANERGIGEAANYTPLQRKDEQRADEATAREVHLNISSANYNVRYEYDPSANSYKRFMGGEPHTDERSGDQIAPDVVVALVTAQGRNGVYTTYQTIGSGTAYVFQDGVVHEGTWHKPSREAQITFTTNDGNELRLNPGQTWITAVGSTDRVTHNP